jgi:aspartate/tyrosine/aromatic aminotransferase
MHPFASLWTSMMTMTESFVVILHLPNHNPSMTGIHWLYNII